MTTVVTMAQPSTVHISEEALRMAQEWDNERRISGTDVKTMPLVTDPYKRQREYFKQKWHNDPEFRKKRSASVVAKQKERYQNDAEYRQKLLRRRRDARRQKKASKDIKDIIDDDHIAQ